MNTQDTVQNTAVESKSQRGFHIMRRIARLVPVKLLLAAAVILSLAGIPLLTKAGDSGHDGNGHGQRTLTGNWLVTVTRVNPPPTLPPTFLSLMTFFDDGNFSDESNTTAIRSTGRGNWEKTGHRQFTRSLNYFRFDATRTFLGMGLITATITISADGSEFQANATAKTYDLSGILLTTLQTTEVGQRL